MRTPKSNTDRQSPRSGGEESVPPQPSADGGAGSEPVSRPLSAKLSATQRSTVPGTSPQQPSLGSNRSPRDASILSTRVPAHPKALHRGGAASLASQTVASTRQRSVAIASTVATVFPELQGMHSDASSEEEEDTIVNEEVEGQENVLPCFRATRHPSLQYRSLFIFSSTSKFRLMILHLVQWWAFEVYVVLIVVANSVTLAMQNPLVSTEPQWSVNLNYYFTASFTLEMLLKWVAYGLVLHPHAYLRVGWNRLDFIIVVLSLATLAPSLGNYTSLRALRLLRPIRSATAIPSMKRLVTVTLRSVSALSDMLMIVFAILCLFGVFGVQLFMGMLHQRCQDDVTGVISNTAFCSFSAASSAGVTGSSCPAGSTCVMAPTNPDFGFTSWDNMAVAWLLIIQVLTLKGWSQLMYIIMSVWTWFACIFFLILIVVGSYLVMNLALAIITTEFQCAQEEFDAEQESEKRRLAMEAQIEEGQKALLSSRTNASSDPLAVSSVPPFPDLLVTADNAADDDGNTSLSTSQDRPIKAAAAAGGSSASSKSPAAHASQLSAPPKFLTGEDRSLEASSEDRLGQSRLSFFSTPMSVNPPQNEALTFDTYALLQQGAPPEEEDEEPGILPQWMSERIGNARRAVLVFVEGDEAQREEDAMTPFARFILFCIIANSAVLAADYYGESATQKLVAHYANIAFTACFTLEMTLKTFGWGPWDYIIDPMNDFDAFIVLISWVEIGLGGGAFSVLRAFRLLRILRLLKAFPSLLAIVNIMFFAVKDASFLIVLLFLFVFIMSLLGMQFFGGKLPDIDIYGATINEHYDSFAESMLVTFQVLTRDNWVEIMHRSMYYTSEWSSLFYVVSIIVGNLMLLNLFVALVINSFTKVGSDLERRQAEELAALEKAQQRYHRAAVTLSDGLHGRITKLEDAQLGTQTVGQKRDLTLLEANRPIENLLFQPGNELNDVVQTQLTGKKGAAAGDKKAAGDQLEVSQLGVAEAMAIVEAERARGQNRTIVGVCVRCRDPIYEPFPSPWKVAAPRTPQEMHDCFCDRIQVRKAKERVLTQLLRDIAEKQQSSRGGNKPTAAFVEDVFGRAWEVGLFLSENIDDHLASPSYSRLSDALAEEKIVVDLRTGEDEFGGALLAYTSANVPTETATNGGISLFLLGRKNAFRIWCTSVVSHPVTDIFIMLVILSSSILLAVENPRTPNSQTNASIEAFVDVSTVIFTIEMTLKILAFGLILHPSSYLRDPWNMLDSFVVVVSILAWALQSVSGTGFLRVLRTFRALRALRLINKNKGLKMVAITLIRSFKGIANVALITLIVWLVFAILGTELFGGLLYQCSDPTVLNATNCTGYFYLNGEPPNTTTNTTIWNASSGLLPSGAAWRVWEASPYNFDNTYNSLLTLFTVGTLDNWATIMYQVIDSTSHFGNPMRNYNMPTALYFVAFVVVGSFFLLAFFVGVVIFQYNIAQASVDGLSFLTPQQKHWIETQRMVLSFRPRRRNRAPDEEVTTSNSKHTTSSTAVDMPVAESETLLRDEHTGALVLRNDASANDKVVRQSLFLRARVLCFRIVEAYAFELVGGVVVLLNIAVIATGHYNQSGEWSAAQYDANIVFVVLFAIEALMKLFALGPQQYIRLSWNVFDLVIVILGFATIQSSLGLPIEPNTLRVLRAFRLLRLLPLIKQAAGVRMLLETLYYALPALGNIGVFLLLVLFIFSVIGVQLFANVRSLGNGGLDDNYANFHQFGNALLMLFRIATLDNWGAVMVATSSTSDCGTQDFGSGPVDTCGVVYAPVYYILFILLTTFVLLNVFTAVILDNFKTAVKLNHSEVSVRDLKRFSDAWEKFDADATFLMETRHFASLLSMLKPPLGLARRGDRVKILIASKSLMIPEHGGVIHFAETLIPLARSVQNVEFAAVDIREHEHSWKEHFPGLSDLPVLRYREVRITVDQYIAATYMQAARRRKLARLRIDFLRKQKEEELTRYYDLNHVPEERRTALHRLRRQQESRLTKRRADNAAIAAMAAEAAAAEQEEKEAVGPTPNIPSWLGGGEAATSIHGGGGGVQGTPFQASYLSANNAATSSHRASTSTGSVS